jgi:fatty acid desaturase
MFWVITAIISTRKRTKRGGRTPRGGKKAFLRYSVEVWLTSYARAFQVGMRSLKKHSDEFQIFLWMMGIHLLLLAFFMYWNFINAMIVFVVPPAISLFSTCWSTYSHHVGLDTKNPYEASNNVINKWYNFFTGNLGYHTAHHIREGLHWSKLPAFHEEIARLIPEDNYYNPGFPFAVPTGLSHRLIAAKGAFLGKNDLVKLGLPGPE